MCARVEASEIDRFYRALQRQAGLSAASFATSTPSQGDGPAVKWGWISESPIPRT